MFEQLEVTVTKQTFELGTVKLTEAAV